MSANRIHAILSTPSVAIQSAATNATAKGDMPGKSATKISTNVVSKIASLKSAPRSKFFFHRDNQGCGGV